MYIEHKTNRATRADRAERPCRGLLLIGITILNAAEIRSGLAVQAVWSNRKIVKPEAREPEAWKMKRANVR